LFGRGPAPSYLPFLLILLVGVGSLPVTHVSAASVQDTSNSPSPLPNVRTSGVATPQMQNGNMTIPGTRAGITRFARTVGRLVRGTNLRLVVMLKFRDGTDPEGFVRSIYDPSSSNYQHYLTPQSFADLFAPSPADYQSVVDWLKSEGFSVTGTTPDRLLIEAAAKSEIVEGAFNTTLSVYQFQNTTFYSNGNDPQLPAKVGSLLNTIVGLHNATSVRLMVESHEADPTYNPSNIRSAYDDTYLTSNLGYTGTGQTIDILDAYDYPNLFSDLSTFDTLYSLPSPSISKILINNPSTCPSGKNYCLETAMDVQWAHVMAPGATLHVVLVPDLSDSSLTAGIGYVVNTDLASGGVFSNSWGGPEMCSLLGYVFQSDPSFVNAVHQLFVQAASQGISTFFSSGDNGAYESCGLGYDSILTVEYPASDNWVTAVGGTSLNSITGPSELGWSGSGGGVSQVFAEPTYQSSDFYLSGRGVPDVSMDADPSTGVYVYCNQGSPCTGWLSGVGGTSLSAPLWAGSVAVLNHALGTKLGFLNPLIYAVYTTSEYSSDFHDVTSGSNGYSAGPGWDKVTGLGSPDLFKMAQNRGMTKVSVSPSTVSQGQTLSYSGSGFTPIVQVQVVIWTDGTGYVVGAPTATNSGTISGSFLVGTNIPLGQRKITFTDSSSGFVATAYVMVTYTVTFQESGIPSGVTWGVTVGGTRYPTTGSSFTLAGLTQPVSYFYDPTVPGASGVQYVCSSGCSGSVSGSTTVTANYETLVTTTVTLTQTSTSYSYRTTTTTSTSYTSTSTLTSTIPTVTTVVLVPLTITSTEQSIQFLTSVLTTTTTSYTGTTTSTSTIPTTVALVPLTMTSTAQSTQYLTSILTTTVTNYTGTETSTSTILVPTTIVLIPLTATSTEQSTQYLTSTATTTVTSYTDTQTVTSTIPAVTTVVLLPSTVTSTIQATQYLTSILTTTVTNYTSTTTSTSTSVVYTTVTASGTSGSPSSALGYLGFLSLFALTVGHRITTGKGRRIPKLRSQFAKAAQNIPG